jgi:hypothetical protein
MGVSGQGKRGRTRAEKLRDFSLKSVWRQIKLLSHKNHKPQKITGIKIKKINDCSAGRFRARSEKFSRTVNQ